MSQNLGLLKFSNPHLNFLISFGAILACMVPKLFGVYDSFNKPGLKLSSNREFMASLATGLCISALPMFLDGILDCINNTSCKKNRKLTRLAASISTIFTSIYIFHHLGHIPSLLPNSTVHISFDFLIWFLRLNMTAALMCALSLEDSQLFPVWQTCLFTLTTATYGLVRFVADLKITLTGLYILLFGLRIILVMNVHVTAPYWVYKLLNSAKWNVSHYAVVFYLLVYTVLTLDFFSASIYKVFNGNFTSAFVNISGCEVERTICCQIIAMIVLTIVPGRLARIELMESQGAILEAKRSFVSYISHELRTPLNTVVAGIKLALKPYQTDLNASLPSISDALETSRSTSCLSEKQREQKQVLRETGLACDVALEILNDFLMFDKLEQKSLLLHKQDVGVIDFMSKAIQMILVQIREKNIKLTLINYISNVSSLIDFPETFETLQMGFANKVTSSHTNSSKIDNQKVDPRCYIYGTDKINIDKHKMNQVIRNLLSNAIKFTPTGGNISVVISFEIQNDTKDTKKKTIQQEDGNEEISPVVNGYLIIKVIDTGVGISTGDQTRLFKEVIQFRPHELQGGGGSGLGLVLTKGIVELHDGTVNVFSEGEGSGSTFTVRIPMTRVGSGGGGGGVGITKDNINMNVNINNETVGIQKRNESLISSVTTDIGSCSQLSVVPSAQLLLESPSSDNMVGYELSPLQNSSIRLADYAIADETTLVDKFHLSELSLKNQLIMMQKSKALIAATATLMNVDEVVTVDNMNNSSRSLETLSTTSLQNTSSRSNCLYEPKLSDTEFAITYDAASEPSSSQRILKLLLVEDSAMSRRMFGRMIKECGHIWDEAENGEVAVENIKKRHYDAVLMDSHMPRMDGPTAAQEMRRLGYTGPIIGMTGDTADRDINYYLRRGASKVLIKPVDIDTISHELEGMFH